MTSRDNTFTFFQHKTQQKSQNMSSPSSRKTWIKNAKILAKLYDKKMKKYDYTASSPQAAFHSSMSITPVQGHLCIVNSQTTLRVVCPYCNIPHFHGFSVTKDELDYFHTTRLSECHAGEYFIYGHLGQSVLK